MIEIRATAGLTRFGPAPAFSPTETPFSRDSHPQTMGGRWRLRASLTACMTRQDSLEATLWSRSLPCGDESRPSGPDDEGCRLASITRATIMQLVTPRNRTARATKLTFARSHAHRLWIILTSPATMPAANGTSRHKPPAIVHASCFGGTPTTESHVDATDQQIGSAWRPRQRQASASRSCRCPHVRRP